MGRIVLKPLKMVKRLISFVSVERHIGLRTG